jgi:hypothetical protein
MDMVVYNGRLYAAPVIVVIVEWGGFICTAGRVGRWWRWFGSWSFIIGCL